MSSNKRDGNFEEPIDSGDGIDRRGFLSCMAWAGTGVLWAMSGGILRSVDLSSTAGRVEAARVSTSADFTFAQISDSHIGFNKVANPNVVSTLNECINRISTATVKPSFVLHTGDLTHLSQADEFDTLSQALTGGGLSDVYYVPGEHDVDTDNGALYLSRYGKGTTGQGWYSFDYNGVHFVGLNNVLDLKTNGLGSLGSDQLSWLDKDLRHHKSDTPIVVFAHIPLWSVYPDWGWGTDDSAQALALLRRFGSVTVLNGHIHQTLQKVEGNITFHTAMSTAFPQPAPGSAPKPGPMVVPAGQLRSLLGVTTVNYAVSSSPNLAVIDSPLTTTPVDATGIVGAGDAH
jgi:Icc protein